MICFRETQITPSQTISVTITSTKGCQQIKEYLEDCGIRNETEGKIGTAKTRYGMGRIRARLPGSGKSVIVLSLMAMNLSKLAKAFLCHFLERYFVEAEVAVVGA